MKGGLSFNGLRGKQLSLVLIALICTTILLWAWEKTPLINILPSQNRLEIISPVILEGAPADNSILLREKANVEEDFSYSPQVRKTSIERTDQAGETRTKGTDQAEEDGSDVTPDVRGKTEIMNQTIEIGTHHIGETRTGRTEYTEEHDSIIAPMDSQASISSQKIKEDEYLTTSPVKEEKNLTTSLPKKNENLTSPMEEKGECNYAKGKWVADSRWPLYSGFGCKQWLSEMWACRLTNRPDFSYERFRWEPQNCKMTEFDRKTFLERMQDKTIALVGDSLGRQQFQSLMCMVTGGENSPDIEDIGKKYGLVKARGSIRPDGWAYRFLRTNTTILYYWSASLCELEPLNISNPATDYAMHLDRPATFLRRYLDRFDVLVLNTGHHWNRGKMRANRWVMYVGGVPNTNRKIAAIGNAKNLTIYSVARWLDSQLPRHPRLMAFFRTISPRHFVNGEWNTGGSCDNTTPLAGGSEVTKEESSDPVVAGAVKGTRVKLLDITALSQLRDECHISKYSIKASEGVHDCLHWCLPGVPDTWNEILAAQII